MHWGSPETLSDVTHPSLRFLFPVVVICLNSALLIIFSRV